MKKENEQMTEDFLWDEDAKRMLLQAERLLNSDDEVVRDSVFIPLVTAGEGCGVSMYARAFSAIVDASPAQQVRGKSTFLDLVFPKGNEDDERLFFSSPRTAASVRNRFYGTMLISLTEYSGLDLIGSPSFEKLLKFMEENRSNIHFIVHITPEFSEGEKLKAHLHAVGSVVEVRLGSPGAEKGYAYVTERLESRGIMLDREAGRFLKERALPEMVAGSSYRGYRSLDAFLGRLCFDVVFNSGLGSCILGMDTISGLYDEFEREEAVKAGSRRIGFCT